MTGIAEELDDIYLRLSELNIDVMDAETVRRKRAKRKQREGRRQEGRKEQQETGAPRGKQNQ